jgi:hypothetical protein
MPDKQRSPDKSGLRKKRWKDLGRIRNLKTPAKPHRTNGQCELVRAHNPNGIFFHQDYF